MNILPNGVAVIDGDTHHGVWCRDEGLVHDKFMAGILTGIIERYKVKEAIDGGGNVGTLTRVMLDMGVRVHAFEPNPEAVECLKHNCPEAKIYQAGLGRCGARMRLVRLPNAGASFVEPATHIPLGSGVQIMPLDLYCICPGLIKLDVEGFEVQAILGGRNMIKKFRPVIVAEVNKEALKRAGNSDQELYDTLHGLDYAFRILQPDCQFGDPQFDIIATPL